MGGGEEGGGAIMKTVEKICMREQASVT